MLTFLLLIQNYLNIYLKFYFIAGVLVYSYILSTEKVKCRSVSESGVSASSCFGGLFASVLGGESNQGKPASWDSLICSLLKLVNKLIQTPLSSPQQVSEEHLIKLVLSNIALLFLLTDFVSLQF